MDLTDSEIKKIRNVFAQFGWEYTPDQMLNFKELESIKKEFVKIKFLIDPLFIKLSNKEITLEEIAKTLNCPLENAKHLLILNSIFGSWS